MDAAYFQAAVPEPYRIFGLQLLPLSLGRYRLLMRFDCAFVADGEAKATIEDLLVGILICSMRVKDFLELLGSRRWNRELKRWGRRVRREMDADPYFNILAKVGLFQSYIQESSHVPNYWNEMAEQGGSAAHWSHNVEVSLRSQLGYTAEEIEEGPLSKALADYFKHAENQGLIRLICEEEVETGKGNAELLQRLMGGGLPCPA